MDHRNTASDSESDISSISSQHDNVPDDYDDYYPSPLEDFDHEQPDDESVHISCTSDHLIAARGTQSPSPIPSSPTSLMTTSPGAIFNTDAVAGPSLSPSSQIEDQTLATSSSSNTRLLEDTGSNTHEIRPESLGISSVFTADAPPTRYGRIRKIREMEELSVCVCGRQVTEEDITANEDVIACKIESCETVWVSSASSFVC